MHAEGPCCKWGPQKEARWQVGWSREAGLGWKGAGAVGKPLNTTENPLKGHKQGG